MVKPLQEMGKLRVDDDAAYLEEFGYRQELRRGLRFTSTFSAAFSYLPPTTGIFGVRSGRHLPQPQASPSVEVHSSPQPIAEHA
jgi:hypothetical protein